jgi:hypothetical protein
VNLVTVHGKLVLEARDETMRIAWLVGGFLAGGEVMSKAFWVVSFRDLFSGCASSCSARLLILLPLRQCCVVLLVDSKCSHHGRHERVFAWLVGDFQVNVHCRVGMMQTLDLLI